jgi:hypothetical protein
MGLRSKLVSIVASCVQSSVTPMRRKMLPKMACNPLLLCCYRTLALPVSADRLKEFGL